MIKATFLFMLFSLAGTLFAADAEYLEFKREYQLNDQGEITFHYYHKIQLNTYQAYSRCGEFFIPYNPEFQKLKIIQARTITPSGNIIPAPEKDPYREYLPKNCSDQGIFNHFKEYIVHHTGLELGCAVELEYQLTSSGKQPLFLNEFIPLNINFPIKNQTVKATIPKSMNLLYYPSEETGNFSIKEDGKYKTYEWSFKDLKSRHEESLIGEKPEDYPAVMFSTIGKAELLKMTRKLLDKKISLPAETKEYLNSVIKNEYNGLQAPFASLKAFKRLFTIANIPFKTTPYQIHNLSISDGFLNGTRYDKWVFLNQWLKDKNIKPIIAFNKNYYSDDFYDFDSAIDLGFLIEEIPYDIDGIRMDAKAYSDFFLYLDIIGGDTLSVLNNKKPMEKRNIQYSFSENNNEWETAIKGEIKTSRRILNYWNYPDSLIVEKLKSIFPKKVEIDTSSIEKSNQAIEFAFKGKDIEMDTIGPNLYRFQLFHTHDIFKENHIDLLPGDTLQSLSVPEKINISETHHVKAPKNHSFVGEPIDHRYNDENISVIISKHIDKQNLEIIRELKIKKDIIESKDYAKFREVYYHFNKKRLTEIILRKE